MSDPVAELFNTPIPERVWHYTTLAGLEGIVSSGTVWATEAHHTTDPNEFVHARAVGTAYLGRIEPIDESTAYAIQKGQQVLGHAFDEGVLSQGKVEIFVASFSSSENLESQWDNYADGSRGVSIAFDMRQIRPPHEIGCAVTFAPCLYVQEEKEGLVGAALDHFIQRVAKLHRDTGSHAWAVDRLNEWANEHTGQQLDIGAVKAWNDQYIHAQLHSSMTYSAFDLLRVASHCKDPSFSPEHEWRLSLPHTKGKAFKGMEIQYRGSQYDTPYLAHNLFSEKLPITQVLAGPLCEDIAQIQELLDKHGYKVPVAHSGNCT